LEGFNKKYRDASPKTSKTIASNLFEHCLWYFVREGGAPKITIWDDGESIDLDEIYSEHMHSSAVTEQVSIKDQLFDFIHVKLRSHNLPAHVMALCAGNRLVKEEKLNGKVPGLFGRISDQEGAFLYACYVSSDFLDECVRPERTGFDLSESSEPLFVGTEISLDDIRDKVCERAAEHLSDYLQESRARSKERVSTFVSRKAPRYSPILNRIPEDELQIDPEISDKDLDLLLHKQLAQIEGQLLERGHALMNPATGENQEDYEKRLNDYLQTVQDLKKSDLANYVSHRKVILDLFGKAIERNEDGKYSREDLIHNLIMPMRMESRDVLLDGCNLWLIDERLAFHDYLASDKTLDSAPITGCEDTKEPDLLGLNVFDNPILVSEEERAPLASIVVVEIKRPMRNDVKAGVEHDPIEQALDYLKRIRAGKVTTRAGRPIPASDQIPGFCYVLADLTPNFIDRCRNIYDLTQTSDGLGYFGYKSNLNAYVEVFSFDRLLNAAKERNRAFFDKLGLPT
jgi:broad specificity phosphatase PhoE